MTSSTTFVFIVSQFSAVLGVLQDFGKKSFASEIFSQKNQKSSLIHQNELITIMYAFLVYDNFLRHFWSIFWSGSGGGLIGPTLYIRDSALYMCRAY